MADWLLSDTLGARALCIVLGALLLALMVRGLKKGSAQLVYRDIRRDEDAILYWAAIASSAAFEAALILIAVFPQLKRL